LKKQINLIDIKNDSPSWIDVAAIKFALKNPDDPCRIGIPVSPPGVCSSSRFVGEGDHGAKNLMVTQRRKGFRQVRAIESATPYVLYSGLY
jgi:hypothetical protein